MFVNNIRKNYPFRRIQIFLAYTKKILKLIKQYKNVNKAKYTFFAF